MKASIKLSDTFKKGMMLKFYSCLKGGFGGSRDPILIGSIAYLDFAFATGRVGPESIPILSFWVLACAIPLLLLAMVEMHRGELLFGTMGMVYGGLLRLGGAPSFIRSILVPGTFPIDGWWFFSTGIAFFSSFQP